MPVRELCRLFLEERAGTDLRPKTLVNYESLFRKDLLPVCGEIPLGKVDRAVLQKVIQRMIGRGLDPVTIEGGHGRISGLFRWAVTAGYLPETPVKRLSLPICPSRSSGKMLSASDAVKILAVLEGKEAWLPTFLALHTGMRPGEVLGLSWDDVDLTASVLSVRHTMGRGSEGLRLGPPKTRISERTVAVSEDVVAVLRDVERSKPEVFGYRRRSALLEAFHQVCAREDGSVLNDNAWRKGFNTGLERAGLPHIRLHDLRHTHASLLLLDRMPMHVVSKRLGHSKIQTTIDLYGHLRHRP